MKVVLQRVSRAAVRVEGREVGAIRGGILLLVGFGAEDADATFDGAIEKILNLRIFPDTGDDGGARFHRSVRDIGGEILIVSQFTLYADTSRGRRPDFGHAAPPDRARELYARYIERWKTLAAPAKVATGVFGAMMEVELVNDGPVTLIL